MVRHRCPSRRPADMAGGIRSALPDAPADTGGPSTGRVPVPSPRIEGPTRDHGRAECGLGRTPSSVRHRCSWYSPVRLPACSKASRDVGCPLYGRLETVISLAAFDYFDAGEMMPRYSPADRVRTYAAFGGMLAYLAHVDDTLAMDQNMHRAGCSCRPVNGGPDGAIGNRAAGGPAERGSLPGNPARAWASARLPWERSPRRLVLHEKRCASRCGTLSSFPSLRNDLDFGTTRRQTFQLSDPAERFFYGITLPLESAAHIWRSRANQLSERIAQHRWPTYVGQHVFEEVAAQAYQRWGPERGLPVVPEWRRWTGKDRTRRQVDIDLVGRTLDDSVITGSVKFRNRPAVARHLSGAHR